MTSTLITFRHVLRPVHVVMKLDDMHQKKTFFSSSAHCEPETLHQAGKSLSFTDFVMNVIDVHQKK